MKYILVFVLLFSFLYADEIKRIESIVKDITEIRQQNEICQKELYLIKKKQVKEYKYSNKNQKYKLKIKKLKSQINKYKKSVKTKDKEIKRLIKLLESNEQKLKNSVYKKQNFDNPNKFPNLILKKEYRIYKIKTIKPATYRLKNNTEIYDKINGVKIKTWEKGTSFTTNIKATVQNKESWFKITGFFINGIWVKSQSKMWVKAKYAKKR